jgi:iron(III) transport system ATP-binding protein
MNVVVVERLAFSYDRKQPPVLRECSFAVRTGEIVGVVGPSGCGKSTLLRLIAGLELPDQGRIEISGLCVADERIFVKPESRGVGMVFQDYALFPHMTAAENIAFGLHRMPRAKRAGRVKEMLELVHMAAFAKRYPHELSGGQQQRVALARALAPEPHVLLMDEPFSNLDADLKAAIRMEVRTILKQAGMTCLFVTHDQQDVEAICDRCIRLSG